MKREEKHDNENKQQVKQISPGDVIYVSNNEINRIEQTIDYLQKMEQDWDNYKMKVES